MSFALDNAFLRDPEGGLPPDATNSTRIDFQDPLLRKVLPLVGEGVGLIRIGGTYTDFVHYEVPGTNYTRCPYQNITKVGYDCPGNSFPCCLPMSMERWTEALEFAGTVGMKIAFNLNILHGRWKDYQIFHQTHAKGPLERPPWDSSNARALMEYTVQNVAPSKWPAAFGLGNELANYLTAEQWARDTVEMHALVKEIFPADQQPLIFGPCNANTDNLGKIILGSLNCWLTEEYK